MSYDYSAYANGNDNDNSGSSNGGGSSGSGQSKTVAVTPNATIEGDLTKVFGNANQWGQSLGISWEDAELVDGCLYHDPDKDKYKVFSWKEVVGITPKEDEDMTADAANQYLVKNYGGTEKRYELVKAVIGGKDDPAEIGEIIMWYSGSAEYGAKSASVTLAKILTKFGNDAVVERENVNNWLIDNSGDNILREDLQGRRFAFFEVKRDSNQSDYKYQHPIVIDTQTDSKVVVQNSSSAGSAAETETEMVADSPDDVPEPIADFISTCDSLGFDDRDRAATLLDDLIGDSGNDLTADMVDTFGGEGAVLDAVAN
mgnify:FL=1